MNALHQYLSKHLADRLKQRRIVVWYDPRSAFRPYIAELEGGKSPAGCVVEEMAINDVHAQLCIYNGSFFEVRAAVEPLVAIDYPAPLLIYIPGMERDRQDSVLMELEKSGDCYEPQLRRLARDVLRQRYTDGVIDSFSSAPIKS